MSYALAIDEPVGDEIRRIAAEQLDRAIDDLTNAIRDDPTDAIHDARKRCKKFRGLVRLVRPALGDDVYRVANDTTRDAARELSELRDATALLETFRLAVDCADCEVDADAVEHVERALNERHLDAQSRLAVEHPPVERARELLLGARAASDRWELDADGCDAIGDGVQKTYTRGRRAFGTVADGPTGEHFHEWRKRVKYTWYHLRLVEDASPAVLGPLVTSFHSLSSALGDAHDLVVLTDRLPTLVDDADHLRTVEQLLGGYRSVLEHHALVLGARLYAEQKSDFADRLGSYWSAHLRFGPEREVGGLDELW